VNVNDPKERRHLPVLVDEVSSVLFNKIDGIYIDCTIGEGGHSEKILHMLSDNGRLIGIDLDPAALESARERLSSLGNCVFINDNFRNIRKIINNNSIAEIDGVLFDLGISSLQLESPEKGFSFSRNGPLDMRFGAGTRLKASTLVNNLSFEELSDIFWKYGEEPQSRIIAKEIIREREKKPIETTAELGELIERTVRFRGRIHPATRVFQALRIAVNDELENLKSGLSEAIDCLKPGGRICVISFHSLEDRIVKNEFRTNSHLKALTKKPVTPGEQELGANPRSRSAKLRAAEKI